MSSAGEEHAVRDYQRRWPRWSADDYKSWTVFVCPLCSRVGWEGGECFGPMGAGAHEPVEAVPFVHEGSDE